MGPRGHLRLLAVATLVWAAFLAGGLPDYYRQYSTGFMVVFDLAVLPPIAAAVWLALRRVRHGRRRTVSLWFAFYFTVPLALYDGLYCGLLLGHGLRFLVDFWFLSVYYLIPWVLFPGVAAMMGRGPDRG